jgi:hypothetical protein
MTEQTGHPLPESEEARHGEIPERIEEAKGEGDDGKAAIQPTQPAARPDGAPYEVEGGARPLGDFPSARDPAGSTSEWDREQGIATPADTPEEAPQSTSWDQQQGIAGDAEAEGESEFERDQRDHQRRGQDDVDKAV